MDVIELCVQRGLSVTVGTIIQTYFLHICRGTTIVILSYPSLIYALRREGEIVTSLVKEVVHPKPTLTKNIISQFTSKQLFTNTLP